MEEIISLKTIYRVKKIFERLTEIGIMLAWLLTVGLAIINAASGYNLIGALMMHSTWCLRIAICGSYTSCCWMFVGILRIYIRHVEKSTKKETTQRTEA